MMRSRTLAVIALGTSFVAAEAFALRCDRAGAAGGVGAFLSRFGATPVDHSISLSVDTPISPVERKAVARSSRGSRQAVCVRLCDGYFFPFSAGESGAAVDEQAACADLCPGAAATVYFLPAGSDRIEDAYSRAGARYAALDTALRYRTTHDNTCACHLTTARTTPYWRDPTLQKGDAVMTATGIVVYQGGAQRPENFTPLAEAPMSPGRRAKLAALGSASALAANEVTPTRVVPLASSAKTETANETGPTAN